MKLSKNFKNKKTKSIYSGVGLIFFSLLGVVVIVGFAVVSSNFYDEVIYMAYLSVVSECDINGTAIVESQGYERAGRTTATYENGNLTNIFISFRPNPETIRHELCHVQQAIEDRQYDCSFETFFFFNEVECYIKQKNPNYKKSQVEELMKEFDS